MGEYREAEWASDADGATREQRWGGVYRWYLPTPLSELDLSLDADVAGDVSRAERALFSRSADGAGGAASTEGLARLLLRSEAVASSRIEGLSVGAGRLARAELESREPGSVRHDRAAAQVLGNIHAMDRAVEAAAGGGPVTVGTLSEIHRALLAGTGQEHIGGVVRREQNWVGGGSWSPHGAVYVPPAPEEVPRLLDDLAQFANRRDVPPVVQAAVCHSQFESIHPFLDGNGRVGRALVQVVLMRAGVPRGSMPPVSLALATDRRTYISALAGMQSWTAPDEGRRAVGAWLSTFAGAVLAACRDREEMAAEMAGMARRWEEALGGAPRRGSALSLLIPEAQAMPYFTVETMARATGRSYAAVNAAVSRLVEAGVAVETTKGKRNRVFLVPDVVEEFELVERRLASPARDTRAAPPARPVPQRRRGARPAARGTGGGAADAAAEPGP